MRWLLFAVVAFISATALAHDLDLTSLKLDRKVAGTTLELTTPLSRFVRTLGCGPSPSAAEIDVAVRERLGVSPKATANLEIDTQSDMLHWTGALAATDPFIPRRFDASTPAARTLYSAYLDGKFQSDSVLGESQPSTSFWGMVGTGVAHILTGADHILFILGLALLKGGWKSKLKLLTAFTVAHSASLALSCLGFVHLSPRIVEPLIALSIVALAVEAVLDRESSDRFKLATVFGFGLVHGLGFAGGLRDLGMNGSQVVSNLFAFNLGIEAGQVLVILPCLGLLAVIRHIGQERLTRYALVAFGMVGCFWLAERLC